MTDKNLYWRIGLIVLIVTLSVWAIWPPSQQLKGGIDLVGGTSLLYEIDTSGLLEGDKRDLAERVMRRLKQRVDPQGQRNLVWRPIGQNRLEIQMPRPPKELAQRREAYEKAREALRVTRVDRGDIEAALALTGPAREDAIQRLIRGVPARAELLNDLVAAKDKLAAADAAGAATRPAAETQAAFAGLDQAREEYYQGFDKILATNINLDRLGDILALGAGDKDRAAKLTEFETSYVEHLADAIGVSKDDKDRAATLERLRSECADIFARIGVLTASYDEWAKNKGALEDPSDLMRLLRGQGVLEFRILAERDPANSDMIFSNSPQYREPISKYTEQLAKYGPRRRPGDNFQWFKIGKPDEFKPAGNPIEADYLGTKYVLAFATPDMGLLNDRTWQLTRAIPDRDQRGRWSVSFTLDPAGGRRFEKLTETNKGHPLCILLDNEAMSAPNIQSAIREHGQITGDFTIDEVTRLCNILEAGSLDARLKDTPLSIQTIGPSLGEQNRRMGMQACITALIAVVAFMAIYYLYGGVISDIALALNMIITLGIMALIQGTFTLQGIAGLVLMLGMAVDANVLIFERIREEQARGVSLKTAVKLGYDRAFWVIFDSNLTTVISAIILGYVGTEEIKGFALTLGLGLCVSMFTALFVTRQFFNVLVQTRVSKIEAERCWGGSAIIAVAGGLILALGWVVNRGDREWYRSGLAGLGEFLLVAAATALILLSLIWIMRWIAIATGAHKTNRIPMLYLLKPTSIDWMSKQKYFWSVSAVLTLGGLLLFALQPNKNLLDIEFLGGTAVQVTVEPKSTDKPVTDAQIEAIVRGTQDRSQAAGWINWAAGRLEVAEAKPGTDQGSFVLLSNDLDESQIEALLSATLQDKVAKDWISPAPGGARGALVRLKDMPLFSVDTELQKDLDNQATSDALRKAFKDEGTELSANAVVQVLSKGGAWRIEDGDTRYIIERAQNDLSVSVVPSLDIFKQDVLLAARNARASAADLSTSARVQSVSEYGIAPAGPAVGAPTTEAFEIVTTDTNKKLVGEAVLAALGRHDDFTVRVERGIGFQLATDAQLAPDGAFPIQADDRSLGDVIGSIAGPAATTSVARYKGGLAMVFDRLNPPQTIDSVGQRLRDMRLQPDYERYGWRNSDTIGLAATGEMAKKPDGTQAPTFTKVAIVVSDENVPFYDGEEAWRRDLAAPELQLAQAALSSERSLDKVTTFAPQVAAQAAQQAIIALVLALFAMVAYLWFRFGTMEYGLGAIIALIHDVAVALGIITATHWIAKTPIGHALLISEMRIDLSVVAALLTIVGYSVNDTIVIFDRIRENRGRLATLSPRLINDAVNQTVPRTILTAFTVFIVVLILYVMGGPGVHAFAFAMLIGTLTGCYSSIAIAAPVLYKPSVMRAMLAIIVFVTAVGLIIGGETLAVKIGMAIVAAIVLGLIGLWQLRRRGAEARLQAA